MDTNLLNRINNELKLVKEQKEKIKKRKQLLSQYEDYDGEDRVVAFNKLQQEFKNLPKEQGVYTQIPKLDKLTDGFRKGNLIIVSGTTGSGKTTLLQTFVKNIDQPILFFTYEVPPQEFLKKFEKDMPKFAYLPRRHKGSKLDWLEQRIIEGMAKYNTNIVMIDHLHFLLDMKYMAKGNTSLMIGAIMRELKRMTIDYGIIIFLVAHTKKVRFIGEEMPDLDSLRDSGMIAAESDFVIFVDRKMTEDKKQMDNKSMLFLAKNRWNGNTGWTQLIHKNDKFIETSKEDYLINTTDENAQ